MTPTELIDFMKQKDNLLSLLDKELETASRAIEKYRLEQDMINSVARNLVTLLILNPGVQNQDTEAVLSQLANLLMKER